MPPGEATTRYKGVSHTPSGRYSVRLTAESVTAFVGSLSTAREACHAHDILRLAREHLHGAKKYSAKRLHFPAATYADMGDHIRGCRSVTSSCCVGEPGGAGSGHLEHRLDLMPMRIPHNHAFHHV